MNELSVPAGGQGRQELFWSWVDQAVASFTREVLKQVLLSEQQEQIGAGWNERPAGGGEAAEVRWRQSQGRPSCRIRDSIQCPWITTLADDIHPAPAASHAGPGGHERL